METRSGNAPFTHRAIGVAASVALAGLILLPAAAPAFDNDFGGLGWQGWYFQNQRESIASQEEASRIPGRERRREEVAQEKEKEAAEHEVYFNAVLEASQAALMAPTGAYYRLPGHISSEPPQSGADPIVLDGLAYLYDRGIFWLQQGSRYVVVTAPAGAMVPALPALATKVSSTEGPVWYYFGAFFAAKGGAYQVVKPPAGLIVFYVPDGYTQETVKGINLLKFGETYFQPVFIRGVLFYKVAGA